MLILRSAVEKLGDEAQAVLIQVLAEDVSRTGA